jgi:hypothetical protein
MGRERTAGRIIRVSRSRGGPLIRSEIRITCAILVRFRGQLSAVFRSELPLLAQNIAFVCAGLTLLPRIIGERLSIRDQSGSTFFFPSVIDFCCRGLTMSDSLPPPFLEAVTVSDFDPFKQITNNALLAQSQLQWQQPGGEPANNICMRNHVYFLTAPIDPDRVFCSHLLLPVRDWCTAPTIAEALARIRAQEPSGAGYTYNENR